MKKILAVVLAAVMLVSLAACVRKHNMTIQSLHAPHKGIPLLWNPDTPASVEAQNKIISCI